MQTINLEWLEVLCIVLCVTSMIQLIFVGILLLGLPHILTLTGCSGVTEAGAIAGLLAILVSFKVKTTQKVHTTKEFGYTLCYQKMSLCACILLHSIASVLAIHALSVTSPISENFLTLMKHYHVTQSSKVLVDDIQYALQCCGSVSYMDWYDIDWKGSEFSTSKSKRHKIMLQLFVDDTDSYPDLSLIRKDAVPFSCCARLVQSECIHQNLVQLGIRTINTFGCSKTLAQNGSLLLWIELLLYFICLCTESAVLILLQKYKERQHCNGACNKKENYINENEWGQFSNHTQPEVAEIEPSEHSEVTLHAVGRSYPST